MSFEFKSSQAVRFGTLLRNGKLFDRNRFLTKKSIAVDNDVELFGVTLYDFAWIMLTCRHCKCPRIMIACSEFPENESLGPSEIFIQLGNQRISVCLRTITIYCGPVRTRLEMVLIKSFMENLSQKKLKIT